jgi:hypothetical protein
VRERRMRMYDSKTDTLNHIFQVRKFIERIEKALRKRALKHDKSKLYEPEKPIFDEFTPKLKNCTYGSDEYKTYLKEMQVALDHHYANNRHHPEHFKKYVCNGCFKEYKKMPNTCDVCGYSQFQKESDITQMNLVDLCEMIADWKAATLRHSDGDILKSIEINQKRFGYSDELKQILINTVMELF